MSAAQRIGGKVCPECQLPLEGEHPGAMRHPLCQIINSRFLRRALRKKHAAEGRVYQRPCKPRPAPAQFKSLAPREAVRAQPDAPRSPRMLCPECCGCSWVRCEGEYGGLKGIPPQQGCGEMSADGVVRCRGCGEAYAPERKPEPVSVLGSSAGTAAGHGYLFGEAKKYDNRPSRAKPRVD